MKFKEPPKIRRPRAAEALGHTETAELEPNWAEIRRILLETKQKNEQVLARQAQVTYTYREVRGRKNAEYSWYVRMLFALRVLFPNEPELGELGDYGVPESIPQQLPPEKRFKEPWRENVGEDEWEYIILLNSKDWRSLSGEYYHPPSAAEFLYEFRARREQKNWISMARIAFAGMHVHPEIAQQLKTGFSKAWPEIMASEWGPHWYEKDVETLALGVLINPELRSSVNVQDPRYIAEKQHFIQTNYGEGLAWCKIIEAETAGFNERHNLVITESVKAPLKKRQELPERTDY